ncbi:MAG TPA: Na+/H+ antiporter NhaA [Chitinophagales bacterium]
MSEETNCLLSVFEVNNNEKQMLKQISKINRRLWQTIQVFVQGGNIVITSAVVALLLANANNGETFVHFWHTEVIQSFTVEWFVNDVLMSFFFLLVGLEIKREIVAGSLADKKTAALPVLAALGGMLVPAGIFALFNYNQPTSSGWAIPMATDIAFALAVLNIVKKYVPNNALIMLSTLAVADDLGAVLVIAIFYTAQLNFIALSVAAVVFAALSVCNKMNVKSLFVYLALGIVLWFFVWQSGIHATIAAVLLAFSLPYSEDENSAFQTLEHALEKPVNYFVLPVFALCNTAIIIEPSYIQQLASPFALGIIFGLVVGKVSGIFSFSWIAVKMGWANLPINLRWRHVFGLALLGGIGFTMSIFVALLAFDNEVLIAQAKLYIIIASLISAVLGLLYLRIKAR